MFKRLARSPVIPWIGGTLIWAYQSLAAHTLRWQIEGIDNIRTAWNGNDGWMFATWHSRIILMPMVKIIYGPKWGNQSRPPALMVSNSRDGEFTKRAAGLLGLAIIRGSAANKTKTKDKRGFLGAKEAMQAMKNGGGVVVTIDGPNGPPEVVGMGAIKLAQQVGAPIIVYGLAAPGRRMRTWDQLLFPRLFSRAAMVVAEPIPTSKTMDSEDLRRRVEQALKAASARAEEIVGLPAAPEPALHAPPMSVSMPEASPRAMEQSRS